MTEDEQNDEIQERLKWLRAIKTADKAEKAWRDEVVRIVDRYRGDKQKKNSFNILFSNTDTLSPVIFNSVPKPDCRRRWSDADPLGKAVAEVLNRALEFSIDTADFADNIQLNTYDYLLSGRAVARVRYVPQFQQIAGKEVEESPEEDQQEADEGYEELAWEQVIVEHVQYDDFRRGPGRTWEEVCWIAFKHNLDKEEIAERFGEDKAKLIAYAEAAEEDKEGISKKEDKIKDGTAEVWEIWDREEKAVIFLSAGYSGGLLSKVDDPLQLIKFYPIPKPAYAFIDPTSLIPVPLFAAYQQQADELDRVSARIDKVMACIKARGVYDSTLSEMSQLTSQPDGALIAVQNYAAIADKGGLDKAIWMMPITELAQVLTILTQHRETVKQMIYEIMGLSDILRGSSNANETAAAQNIKAQWGGQRVGRMQRAMQVYIRDLVRLMAEVIGQRFSIETLQGMTGLQYQTQANLDAMAQQALAKLQAAGQQPTPQQIDIYKNAVTWEKIKAALADDISRQYKIDIETDSTLAASQDTDMQGLNGLLAGIANLMKEYAPAVQAGVLPPDAAKELIMSVIRRAKLGSVVEDSFDKMTQPQPPQPPQDNSLQIEQAKQMAESQRHQAELQTNAQVEQIKQQAESQRENDRMMLEKWKAELESSTRITVAQISAATARDTAATQAANETIIEDL